MDHMRIRDQREDQETGIGFMPFDLWTQLFHDGGRYHIETSPLANQWTGFYMTTASGMKELSFYLVISLFSILN